ncbi:MAG: aminoacyl-histidine dipeptidase [Bacteroidales bacterium]|nr:aminoacyl-histidine dipeptidase [Bacteroidales bacterium]MBN2757479.1 aminoacyl-histidine dipeptidase [Bacteroidales bacterium]
MSDISNLKPNLIWKYFDEITKIPRPSKKEEKIIQYLLNFAKNNNLEAEKDDVGNVVIRKKATKGMENVPIVILQSHSDMVCEKNNDVDFNFDTDSIKAYVDGDWVTATGTTLGADDGIGVAAALAILSSDDLQHGPIEALFTSDEETGMTGAFGLKEGFLKGSVLINLDSEDEGQIFIGCAGGKDSAAEFEYKKEKINDNCYSCKISISGLKGGHSGDEIDSGLGNANKILNRFLWRLSEKIDFRLSNFDGGNLRNAIAREAYAIISVKQHDKEQIRLALNIYSSEITNELAVTEPDLNIEMDTVDNPDFVIDKETQKRLIQSIYACPHGVIAMSQSIDNLVETSTNLASVKFIDDKIIIGTSQRSSVNSALIDISTMVKSVFELAGAKVIQSEGYPGWKPKLDSKILQIAKKSYQNLFTQDPQILAIHAGLECGLFLKKYPQLDMVSIGPTVKGAHSPDERIYIPSVVKFWDLLIDILKNIK